MAEGGQKDALTNVEFQLNLQGKDDVSGLSDAGTSSDFIDGDLEIVDMKSQKNSTSSELMDALGDLRDSLKSSDWVKKQTEAVKEGQSPLVQGAAAATDLEPGEDFEIVSSADNSGALAGLMKDLHQSIKSSDWLEEHDVKHMQQQNPQLIADFLKSRSQNESSESQK